MEGIRRVIEANFGVAACQAKWRALLAADYFTFPLRNQHCPLCHAVRLLACGNHFCMECSVGGLCHAQFWTGGDHGNHPHIQVYKVTHGLALRVCDLKAKDGRSPGLLSVGQLLGLQKYSENRNLHCKFFWSQRGNLCRRQAVQGLRLQNRGNWYAQFIDTSSVLDHMFAGLCSSQAPRSRPDACSGPAACSSPGACSSPARIA